MPLRRLEPLLLLEAALLVGALRARVVERRVELHAVAARAAAPRSPPRRAARGPRRGAARPDRWRARPRRSRARGRAGPGAPCRACRCAACRARSTAACAPASRGRCGARGAPARSPGRRPSRPPPRPSISAIQHTSWLVSVPVERNVPPQDLERALAVARPAVVHAAARLVDERRRRLGVLGRGRAGSQARASSASVRRMPSSSGVGCQPSSRCAFEESGRGVPVEEVHLAARRPSAALDHAREALAQRRECHGGARAQSERARVRGRPSAPPSPPARASSRACRRAGSARRATPFSAASRWPRADALA